MSQLRYYQNALKSFPTNEDIISHIKSTKKIMFELAIHKAKNQVNHTNKINRKIAIRRASENARRRVKLQYAKQVLPFSEFRENSEDGWKNRMINEIGEYVFVFRGYVIRVDNDFRIISVEISQVLQSFLTYIDVIFHLDENECQFDEYFLTDRLTVAESILQTKYSDYLPRPPKLRRSYNGDLYQQVAKVIIVDGWKNRTMCLFDEHCYLFQFRGIKYTVDIYGGLIDRIIQF